MTSLDENCWRYSSLLTSTAAERSAYLRPDGDLAQVDWTGIRQSASFTAGWGDVLHGVLRPQVAVLGVPSPVVIRPRIFVDIHHAPVQPRPQRPGHLPFPGRLPSPIRAPGRGISAGR